MEPYKIEKIKEGSSKKVPSFSPPVLSNKEEVVIRDLKIEEKTQTKPNTDELKETELRKTKSFKKQYDGSFILRHRSIYITFRGRTCKSRKYICTNEVRYACSSEAFGQTSVS